MKNIKPLMRRVCAYMIDLFIVIIIASLISSIPFLNKSMDAYQKKYEEYEGKFNEYSDYLILLEESYEDKEINGEEYTKLTENDTYKDIIISKYEDEKLSQGEYKEIVENINKEFDTIANEYVYILGKNSISNSIITLICTLLYFGVIQYFFKGQTTGKKLLKLKVVAAPDKKINMLNYILRSLIVNDVLLNTVSIILLLLASQNIYTNVNNILGYLISIIEVIIIFLVMTREDQRGLHDLLFNTKVIPTETEKDIPETKEKKKTSSKSKKQIIDVEFEEKNQ